MLTSLLKEFATKFKSYLKMNYIHLYEAKHITMIKEHTIFNNLSNDDFTSKYRCKTQTTKG